MDNALEEEEDNIVVLEEIDNVAMVIEIEDDDDVVSNIYLLSINTMP
jgi:hypothetical protein